MSNNKLNKPNLGAHLQGPGSAAWKQSWWTLRWMWIYINTRVTAVGGLSLLVNSQSFRVGGGIKPSDRSNFLLSDLPTDRHCDAASFVLLVVVSFPITLTLRCGIVCNCCWCMLPIFSWSLNFQWNSFCGMLRLKGLWGVERLLECMDGWQRQRQECQSERTEDCDSVSHCESVTGSGLFFGDYRSFRHSSGDATPCLPPRRPLHCLALTAPPMCNVKHHLDIFHNNARWSLPKIPRRCPWQFNFSTIYPENLIDQTYQTMTASHSRSIFPK